MTTDLWGEPLPEQAPLPTLPGPHHLDIPERMPGWLKESLLQRDEAERDPVIQRWLDDDNRRHKARERDQARRKAGNPCVKLYGAGQAGTTCATCSHLFMRRWAGTYYKCDLRPDSHGTASDHRKRWPACGRYEPHTPAPAAGTAAGGAS